MNVRHTRTIGIHAVAIQAEQNRWRAELRVGSNDTPFWTDETGTWSDQDDALNSAQRRLGLALAHALAVTGSGPNS